MVTVVTVECSLSLQLAVTTDYINNGTRAAESGPGDVLSQAERIKYLAEPPCLCSTRTSLCPLCREREGTLEHFLYECTELQDERKEAKTRTGAKLPRTQEAVKALLEAGTWESMLIHQIYKARVKKETEISPDTTVVKV